MIKIILADDSPVLIDGIQSNLKNEPNIKIIGTANNMEELLNLLEKTTPDLLIMEVKLGDEEGFVTAKMILEKYPEIRIVFFTHYESNVIVKKSFSIGAKACLLKNLSNEEFIYSIKMAHRGEVDFFYKKKQFARQN